MVDMRRGLDGAGCAKVVEGCDSVELCERSGGENRFSFVHKHYVVRGKCSV